MRGCKYSISSNARVPHFRTPITSAYSKIENQISLAILFWETTRKKWKKKMFAISHGRQINSHLCCSFFYITCGSLRLVFGKWILLGKTTELFTAAPFTSFAVNTWFVKYAKRLSVEALELEAACIRIIYIAKRKEKKQIFISFLYSKFEWTTHRTKMIRAN